MTKWIVVGIGGATCSGKTTISKKLHKSLTNSVLINQDTYFFLDDDPRHVKNIELNHNNYDILSSLDMVKMHNDILKILSSNNELSVDKKQNIRVLILDGFLLYNYKPIADICDFKYFLTLTKDQCYERRILRVYDPPDVPGYFELVVWPEYVKYKKQIEDDKEMNKKIIYIDGMNPSDESFQRILQDISSNEL